MSKKLNYMVLDCETATLPYVNEKELDAEQKKKIAIAKPLIYDIGWTRCDRQGTIIDSKQFLIAETFAVPSIFDTAYYKEKRPLYIEMMNKGEIEIKPWRYVASILIEDMKKVDAVGAFNSMFDFKKAIPYTDLYINMLYSAHFYDWYENQKKFCDIILKEKYQKDPDKEFDPNNFIFHGVSYPLFDIWGLATSKLLDNQKYKTECIKHQLITNSGIYFKTSAESSYQYLCNKYDFIESHTALSDALIETYILSKIAKRGKIEIGIQYFPFKELGNTDDFVLNMRYPKLEYIQTVYNSIDKYLQGITESSPFSTNLENRMGRLKAAMGI